MYILKDSLSDIGINFTKSDSIQHFAFGKNVLMCDNDFKFVIIISPQDCQFFRYEDIKKYVYKENGKEKFVITSRKVSQTESQCAYFEQILNSISPEKNSRGGKYKKNKMIVEITLFGNPERVLKLPLYSDSLLDLDSLTINNQFDMERYKQLMIQMLEVSKAFSVILNQESRFTYEKREKNGHIEYDININ